MKVTSKMATQTEVDDPLTVHFATRLEAMTHFQRQGERDQRRGSLQAPISAHKYRVMYLKNGQEHKSAWLYREEHAAQALAAMQAKYGNRNAIIYVD